MTDREQLQEQYEDALFALLMDDLAEKQGQIYRAENEELKQDAAYAVPERTYGRCMKRINCCFAGRALKQAGKIAANALSKLSVAVFAGLLLLTSAMAVSPRLRADTLQFVFRFSRGSAEVVAFTEDHGIYLSDGTLTVNVDWCPEGYSLSEMYEGQDFFTCTYENESGGYIYVDVSGVPNVSSIDTYQAKMTDIKVQGNDGIMSEKEEECILMWADTGNNCSVIVVARNVGADTALRFAEGLKISR